MRNVSLRTACTIGADENCGTCEVYSVIPAMMTLAHNQLSVSCVECSIALQYVGSDVLLFNDIRQLVLHYFLLII